MNITSGGSIFLSLLKDEGVTHMFGNPGTTELPIMHAMREHQDLTYVLGLQESLVVAMADGFSRASGKLTACNVHVAPGLGNAIGSIYNARFTGTPMIITAGQQEQGHGLTEPLLYDPLVPIAEPVVKWATEITRIDDMPRVIRRAAKIATTPPTGPVFLSLPGDVLNEEAGIDLGASTRVNTRVRPADDVLGRLADRILAAKNPVIICGDELVKSDALAEAAQFAETLGADVFQQTVPYGAHYLSKHACFMGTLTRDQKNVRDTLTPYDLMVVLGADALRMSVWSEVDPLPDGLSIVQVGLVDWEMGKNYPVEQAIYGDPRETLKALIPALREKGGTALAERAKTAIAGMADRNWTAKRSKVVEKIESAEAIDPMSADMFCLRFVEGLPDDAVVVHEGLTSTRYLPHLLPYNDRFSYHGFASGGIGWAVPAGVGVQLAQPDRPVCVVVGDGSSMYSIQALWTAANMKLPMTYVIANNGAYRIIKQRLKAFHGNDHYIGMDFNDPAIDFVNLAKSMGMSAQRVNNPDDLRTAVAEGMASGKPNLIDAIVDGTV
jgi:benzoylformate decarboxylase